MIEWDTVEDRRFIPTDDELLEQLARAIGGSLPDRFEGFADDEFLTIIRTIRDEVCAPLSECARYWKTRAEPQRALGQDIDSTKDGLSSADFPTW